MKHKFVFYLMAFSLTPFLLIQKAAAFDPIQSIIAFGDSYSDGGQGSAMSAFEVTREIMESPKKSTEATWLPDTPQSDYVQQGNGRWTNGPTAVEVLAEKLELPLTNYAVGGAKSGEGNYCTWMDPSHKTGLLGQIDKFLKGSKKLEPSQLYFIFISANDYFFAQDMDKTTQGDRQKLERVANETFKNIDSGIRTLAKAGGKQFFIVSSSDLSLVPWELEFHRSQDAGFFTQTLNHRLSKEIESLRAELGIRIVYFDHKAFSDQFKAKAREFGITELSQPCRWTQGEKAKNPPCAQPDQFYFWDEYHPTFIFHRHAGLAMAELLK